MSEDVLLGEHLGENNHAMWSRPANDEEWTYLPRIDFVLLVRLFAKGKGIGQIRLSIFSTHPAELLPSVCCIGIRMRNNHGFKSATKVVKDSASAPSPNLIGVDWSEQFRRLSMVAILAFVPFYMLVYAALMHWNLTWGGWQLIRPTRTLSVAFWWANSGELALRIGGRRSANYSTSFAV